MAVGGGAADGGEEAGSLTENERQLLEGELAEVECTLVGEVQQIEQLSQEYNRKVMRDAVGLQQYVRAARLRTRKIRRSGAALLL